jgi:hypothetical protein
VIYAVVPLVLAVVCVWLGRRMSTLLLVMAYLTLEGFLKLLSNYNQFVHLGMDVVVLTLAAWLVMESVVERKAHLDALPWTKLILTYGVWVALQLLNPYSPGVAMSVAAFKVHLTMIPLYFIAATLFRTPRDVVRFIVGMSVIVILPYAVSIVQYALGPASFLDLSPRYWQNISYYHEFRPFGLSAVPGGSSVLAFLVTPLTLVLLVVPGMRTRYLPIAFFSIAMAAGCFVVSGVRQVFLGTVLTIVVMSVLMMSRRGGRTAVVSLLALALGFGVYTAVQTYLRPISTEAVARDPRSPEIWRERDVTSRLGSLGTASVYTTARDNPLAIIVARATKFPFGAGLGRTGSAAGTFQREIASNPQSAAVQADVGWSDSFFADMIAEVGIPGLVMLTTVLFGMIGHAVMLARRADDPLVAVTAAALAGLFISILAMSYGSQPLLGNPITACFWCFAGLLAGLRRIDQEQRAEVYEDTAEAADLQPAFVR